MAEWDMGGSLLETVGLGRASAFFFLWNEDDGPVIGYTVECLNILTWL